MKTHDFKKLTRMIFTCVILVSLISGFALADVIWEPNDDFYSAHSNDCEYVNRDYYSNGETGYMEFFSEPGGTSLGFADNGQTFHVQFSYKLGDETWGVIEYSEVEGKLIPRGEEECKTGWIKLADTTLKYDYQSFDEAHRSEYTIYDGDYSELKDVQNIVMWTFPNSGATNGTIDNIDENFAVQSIYTDIDNSQWGYVNYYYGMKNFWICLSKPIDATIAAKDVQVPEFNTPSPDSKPVQTGNDMSSVVIICVAAAILCTAVLFASLNKKKRESSQTK
ncbi:MAG: hypothetical protein CVU91_01655 [Firmicutes bacterium HGW-Firmicutes-16]|nr:MAG: hypothetical protein CVU91_01655 [Firmicutes bacterium HGW-Firmicutes-16]